MNKLVNPSKDLLYELYVSKGLKAWQVAEELSISLRKTLRLFKKFDIKKPQHLKFKSANPLILTKEKLKEWYDKGFNLVQMSKLSGAHYKTIKRLLKDWLGKTWTKDDRYGKSSKEGYAKRSANKALAKQEKELAREANRKRNRKEGGKMGLLSRIKSRTTHTKNLSQSKSRTSSELEMAKILFMNNIPAIEQYLIEFYTGHADKWIQFDSMPVDFMLCYPQKHNLRIVLEVDSSFHHSQISKNTRRDSRKNYLLTQAGYIVIRIPDNLVSENVLIELLEIAQRLDKPQLIRIEGMPKYIRKTGEKQDLNLKAIVETPEFHPDPILEN